MVTTFAVLFLLISSLDADASTLTWVRQFGTNAIDEATDVAVTTNAVFAAGETQGASPDSLTWAPPCGCNSSEPRAGRS
jgi:hypothetical protein